MGKIYKTRYDGLGFCQDGTGLWRCLDLHDGEENARPVGHGYRTKTGLLSDLERYAQESWGYDPAAKYVVVDERTLGYLLLQQSGVFGVQIGVLAGSVIRGGADPLNGTITVAPHQKMRQATLEDFAAYRVMPPKYLAKS